MISGLFKTESPTWLTELVAGTGIGLDQLPIELALEHSVFVPWCGLNRRPWRHLAGAFHSFLYVDDQFDPAELVAGLRFRGYEAFAQRAVSIEEVSSHHERGKVMPRGVEGTPAGAVLVGALWTTFRLKGTLGRSRRRPVSAFSLISIQGDPLVAYETVYAARALRPSCVAVLPWADGPDRYLQKMDPQALVRTFTQSACRLPVDVLHDGAMWDAFMPCGYELDRRASSTGSPDGAQIMRVRGQRREGPPHLRPAKPPQVTAVAIRDGGDLDAIEFDPENFPLRLLWTKEDMWNRAIPLRRVLQRSVFYPASWLNFEPIAALAGRFNSFVYADNGVDRESLWEAINSVLERPGTPYMCGGSLQDLQVLHRRSLSAEELVPQLLLESGEVAPQAPHDADAYLPRLTPPDIARAVQHGGLCLDRRRYGEFFAEWLVLGYVDYGDEDRDERDQERRLLDHQRRARLPEAARPGIRVISLLFVGEEASATFFALYGLNGLTPSCMVLDWHVGQTWPDGSLAREVLANPAGTPRYVLTRAGERLNWPNFHCLEQRSAILRRWPDYQLWAHKESGK